MIKPFFRVSAAILTISIALSLVLQNKTLADNAQTINKKSQQQPCPSVKYSDKFEVAFVRKGACGSLKDVEFVIPYNGTCSGSEQIVDMSKYTSTNTGKKCGSLPIYAYTKKK